MSFQEQGVCPICGNVSLDYTGDTDDDGDEKSYECYCNDCDFEGREYYRLVFIGHTNKTNPGVLIEED